MVALMYWSSNFDVLDNIKSVVLTYPITDRLPSHTRSRLLSENLVSITKLHKS